MFDKELVRDILHNLKWAIELIQKRSKYINSFEDFIKDDDGLTKLDSICMQFINIGESLKEIDKVTTNKLLQKYPEVDWKAAKGMRDVITHHYFDIDAEVVFDTIKDKIPMLFKVISKMINDLPKV
ncbi:MAG: DUF86 domain-containing protein [Ignavibacteriaceae bacterium]|nr:DUF86 domain-containing protein [Ignavibacteriaceae bacterium]